MGSVSPWPCEGGQVARGGVMVRIMIAVRVDKMGARHAQLVGAGVHAGHKGVHAAGAQLSYGVGRIVAGTDDEAIEQVEKRHLFALIDRHQELSLGTVRRAGGVVIS